MSKTLLIALGVVLIAAAGVVWLTQHQASARLGEANRLWRQQADQVARLTAENQRLSNILVQVRHSQARANDQLREMLRLRRELDLLREQSNQLTQVRIAAATPEPTKEPTPAPPAPAKEPVEPAAAPPASIPRESWAFAGYATPEAALQSVVWAMSNGDAATYLASLSPAGLQYFQEQLDGKSDTELSTMLRDEVADLKALRLDRKRDAGDGKVSFVLSVKEQEDGAARQRDEQIVVLKNIGGEWRVVAAPDE